MKREGKSTIRKPNQALEGAKGGVLMGKEDDVILQSG